MILIKNKQTSFHICYSKDAHECTRFASTELQKYIYKSTKCLIPMFCDKCDKRSPEILIGDNARNVTNKNGLLSSESFKIEVLDNEIHLVGNTPRADLYAVYYFLNVFLGFRCFSSDVEKIDECDTLEIDKQIIIKDFPFEYREAYWTCAFDGNFASKNMLNSNLADLSSQKGGKVKWYNFHHSFSDLINPNEYFDNHPEYFSLIDNKRIKEHTELCLSNPEVYKLVLEKLKKWIVDNPSCKVFSIAQDEWMGHFTKMACECEDCKRIDDENKSQSGSIITFVNKLSVDIKKWIEDNKINVDVPLIHTFAYQYSRKPPLKVIPHENIIVRLTNIECSWSNSIEEGAKKDPQGRNALFLDDLTKWSQITKRLYIWDYAVNYRNYLLPFPCLRSMYANIMLYKKLNIKGLLMEGNFSLGGNGYLDNLKAYLVSRLMTFDNRTLEEIIAEFCDYYYGKASKKIQEYIFMYEDAIKDHDLWLYDDADSPLFTEEIIQKGHKIVQEIRNLVSVNDKEYERIMIFTLSQKYLELVTLPLDYPKRNELIEVFSVDIRKYGITELFERTNLDYSIEIMKKSRFAKERNNWYSLYYLMK